MDVAVIIPLFNGAQWIRQTLESVFSQSQPPREIVVVDDGSEDESPAIVKSFSGVKLLPNPDKGSQFSRNFGWQQTTSPLVAFLDQDDIWHRDHLQTLSRLLEQYPQCLAAVASCCTFQSDESLTFPPLKVKAELFEPWQNFPINLVDTPSAAVVRRTALAAVGGWTTQFSLGTDAYMWFRLSVHHPLIKNRGITVGYRLRSDSNSTLLRLHRVQHYFETVIAASEAALNHRLAIKPQEAEQFSKRLGILKTMAEIVAATANSDPILLQKSALALEASLSGESEAFVQSACRMLFWFLLPSLCSEMLSQKQKQQALEILSCWPQEAPQTRQVMFLRAEGIVSLRVFLQHLQKNPLQLERWLLLAAVIRRRWQN